MRRNHDTTPMPPLTGMLADNAERLHRNAARQVAIDALLSAARAYACDGSQDTCDALCNVALAFVASERDL